MDIALDEMRRSRWEGLRCLEVDPRTLFDHADLAARIGITDRKRTGIPSSVEARRSSQSEVIGDGKATKAFGERTSEFGHLFLSDP